jgi:hypothetical protein
MFWENSVGVNKIRAEHGKYFIILSIVKFEDKNIPECREKPELRRKVLEL